VFVLVFLRSLAQHPRGPVVVTCGLALVAAGIALLAAGVAAVLRPASRLLLMSA
jgi:hypothetical protein